GSALTVSISDDGDDLDNGDALRDVQQLVRIIDDHEVDDEIVLSVVRDGRTIEITQPRTRAGVC
ncbi:MAG: hypothetical protein COB65_09525, partial [Thalassobium sp.]